MACSRCITCRDTPAPGCLPAGRSIPGLGEDDKGGGWATRKESASFNKSLDRDEKVTADGVMDIPRESYDAEWDRQITRQDCIKTLSGCAIALHTH